MSTIQMNRESLRSVVCMLLAVAIVSVSLTCGVVGVQSLEARAAATLTPAA